MRNRTSVWAVAALMSGLVSCNAMSSVQSATSAPPLTLDTHIDIPNDYMRQARFDAGGDTVLQVDLDKMQRGGLDAIFLVIYVDQGPLTEAGYAAAVAQAERKYSAIEMLLARHPDRVRRVRSPQELRDNHAAGRLSVSVGIENSFSLGHDLARIDAAFQRGARYLGLVHVGNNDLCSSSMPNLENGEPPHNSAADAGMSEFGRAAVARANALGMMVDISHASDACVRAALTVSKTPLLASHSSARALIDHPRNLPDDLIRAIAAKGGVIQAVAYKEFLKADPARKAAEEALQRSVAQQAGDAEYDSEKHDYLPAMTQGMAEIERAHPLATLDDYLAHIRHLVEVAGIDHVGLASDFDGGGGITGWMDASQTANVTQALQEAGFSAADIAKLWGENVLRVWQAAIDAADTNYRIADSTPTVVDGLARAAMSRYRLPGLAIGAVEDGLVSFSRGYGELVAGSGAAVDAQSVFKIASNSKAMTAALLGRLVDQGKLKWDDPVIRHLPQFRFGEAWVTRNFQVRDLLMHNSGLGLGAGDLMLWPEPNAFTRADILAGLAHLKPVTSFRSSYAYDNLLYIVAGELAAAVGGDAYEALLRREVFEPLGLNRCRVGAFERDALGNLAQPHRFGERGPEPVKPDGAIIENSTMAAAGGVRCSLDDMLVWLRNWLDPTLTPGWLSETQRQAITGAQMPMPISARDRRWENAHVRAYGYGLRVGDANGHWRVGHTGTLDGMYSAMAFFPDFKRGYVFLINGEAGDARIVLEAALSRLLSGLPPDFERLADERAAERAASGAAEARAQASERSRVAVDEVRDLLGIYRDPWLGEIALCPEENAVVWRARKSAKLHGRLMRAGTRLLVAWDEPDVASADVWLDHRSVANGGVTLSMRVIDPEADFSYDFHDLSPTRLRACD